MELVTQLGNFGIAPNNSIYELESLYVNDGNLLKDVKLKPAEKIFRCYTQRSLIAGIVYLVKINVEKKIVYFLEDLNAEEIKFKTSGVKLIYLNL